MDLSETKNKPHIQPMTMAELIPEISILSKKPIKAYTAEKQPRATRPLACTSEKTKKLLTSTELKNLVKGFQLSSLKTDQDISSKKKNWNSSVKVDKTISYKASGKLKNNSVRKALNFQPKQKSNSDLTESPKFQTLDHSTKKAVNQRAKDLQVSGVHSVTKTPLMRSNLVSRHNRPTLVNRESLTTQSNVLAKQHTPTPKIIGKKRILRWEPDSPILMLSYKSDCDDSFLEAEKAVQYTQDKKTEVTKANKTDISAPVSTPFRNYRNVEEYFNNSTDTDNSAIDNDTTIATSIIRKENSKREESVIVSLCDEFHNVNVNNMDKKGSECEDLLELEKQAERNIEMISNTLLSIENIKESQMKSLKKIRKLIQMRNMKASYSEKDEIISSEQTKLYNIQKENLHSQDTPSSNPSFPMQSSSKSPTYKIPKKNTCLSKKVCHRSIPNATNMMCTTNKDNKALYIYMKMKENMDFLKTPVANPREVKVNDTPTITSHNLQMQLDRLYNCT